MRLRTPIRTALVALTAITAITGTATASLASPVHPMPVPTPVVRDAPTPTPNVASLTYPVYGVGVEVSKLPSRPAADWAARTIWKSVNAVPKMAFYGYAQIDGSNVHAWYSVTNPKGLDRALAELKKTHPWYRITVTKLRPLTALTVTATDRSGLGGKLGPALDDAITLAGITSGARATKRVGGQVSVSYYGRALTQAQLEAFRTAVEDATKTPRHTSTITR